MPQTAIRIPSGQPMTPALYSVCDIYAFPIVDQKWDSVRNFLREEERIYELAAYIREYRRKFGAPAPSKATIELWKALVGKAETEELDEFDRKTLESAIKWYDIIVSLLEPQPPPPVDHRVAIEAWERNFERAIQRRQEELLAWINGRSV